MPRTKTTKRFIETVDPETGEVSREDVSETVEVADPINGLSIAELLAEAMRIRTLIERAGTFPQNHTMRLAQLHDEIDRRNAE
jgi:hypothetical protein